MSVTPIRSSKLLAACDGSLIAVAEAAGWSADHPATADDAVRLVRDGDHAALLIDPAEATWHGLPARIRAKGGPSAMIPLIALLPDGSAKVPPPMFDDAASAAALGAALDRWRPDPAGHPGPRLAATFGAAPISDMIARLRPRLAEMLERSHPSAAEAHALAGIAGTLGFGEVHRHWIAFSHSDDAALLARARAETRKAVLMIDRGTGACSPGKRGP